ncbi:MAG TPA: Gfo/Idh/MocA family oxidoreductase [Egibacteraceae bacterium]|nr:Gfo/Idh/MocA family oxidoreductase [Egibacteraceae bacterium]
MRVALLGIAHVHADAYIVNLRAAAGVEVTAVADHDAEAARRWGAAHDVPVAATAAEALAGADAAVICAETARHRELVELAADAGVAVLCEKPLATSVEEAETIVAACRTAGVPLMTAFPMRFSPPMQAVAEMVRAGRLGRIRACTGANQSELPTRHRAWFADPDLAGGGALMDHIVHIADALRWFLGEEPVEVFALANRIIASEAVRVETAGVAVVTFTGGTFASIDASWSRPATYPRWGGLTMELLGTDGVTSVDPFRQYLTGYAAEEPATRWVAWGSDPNQAMIDEFIAAAREARKPSVTGEDGLRATQVALAAGESARSGRPVAIAPAQRS